MQLGTKSLGSKKKGVWAAGWGGSSSKQRPRGVLLPSGRIAQAAPPAGLFLGVGRAPGSLLGRPACDVPTPPEAAELPGPASPEAGSPALAICLGGEKMKSSWAGQSNTPQCAWRREPDLSPRSVF